MNNMHPFTAAMFMLVLLIICISPCRAVGGETSSDLRSLSRSQNYFATDLYGELRTREGNLVFSPYSIATALSMTFVGAGGDTATEMATVLHLEIFQPDGEVGVVKLRTIVLNMYAAAQNLFNEQQRSGAELHVANALWGKTNYPFNSEFIAWIKNNFKGNLEPVDFSNKPAACKRINAWVSDQTKDRIRNLLGPNMLTPDTRLVLTNAIYFKAAWDEPFQKAFTGKQKFHVSSEIDVDVDMMMRTGHFDLAELEGFRLLVLPYRRNEMSMLILLPDEVSGLTALEKSLKAQKLASWIAEARSAKVALSFPKFKNTCSLDLKNALGLLGMKKAFDARHADFKGIADVPLEPLYIGMMIHKTFVDVNEEGTEAAASTIGVMMAGAAPGPRREPIPFVVDHPFLFIIQANATGEILFMGRVVDPTKQGE